MLTTIILLYLLVDFPLQLISQQFSEYHISFADWMAKLALDCDQLKRQLVHHYLLPPMLFATSTRVYLRHHLQLYLHYWLLEKLGISVMVQCYWRMNHCLKKSRCYLLVSLLYLLVMALLLLFYDTQAYICSGCQNNEVCYF